MSSPGTPSKRIERGGRSGMGERRPRTDAEIPGLDEIEARHEGEDGSISIGPVVAPQEDEHAGDRTVSPEDALAEAQRVIAAQDARIADAERRAKSAETDRDTSRQQLSTKQSEAVQAQEAAITNAISAATSKREAAKASLRTAREAADMNAELEATDLLTQANAELLIANRNKDGFEAWKRTQANRPQPEQRQIRQEADDGPTEESQDWLGSHPLYFSKTEAGQEYQAQAMAAHSAALAKHIPEGSKAYVEFIDKRLEGIYGSGHGQLGQKKETRQVPEDQNGRVTRQERQQRRASSTGAPTTRDGDYVGTGRGEFEYVDKASGARLRLVEATDRDGRPTETVQGTIPAQWREFARINRMSDIEYAVSQLKIQRDISDGGSLAGLEFQQNGVYR